MAKSNEIFLRQKRKLNKDDDRVVFWIFEFYMFKVFWGFKFQIFAGNEFEERGKMMTIELSFGFPIEHPNWVLHLPHDWWTWPQAQLFLTLDHQLDGNLDCWTPSWCLRDLRLLVREERPAMIGGAKRIIGLPSSSFYHYFQPSRSIIWGFAGSFV